MSNNEELQEEIESSSGLARTVTIGDNIEAMKLDKCEMGLIIEEMEEGIGDLRDGFESFELGDEIERPASPPLCLAAGLGIDDDGGSGLIVENLMEGEDVEEYYRKLIEEYPGHPLVLRKYAQMLQNKGDLHGAEDYYYRASLSDPGDGEILSQYANLTWQLHRDKERALIYFERAVQTAPEDSHVLGAYACFLWEVDDSEEDLAANPDYVQRSDDVEEHFKSLIAENPSNSQFLRDYARFLYQSKGDIQAAEEYYSRAILSDPHDGEILSEFGNLVWDLYHDQERALSYFERAVQTSPNDSNILAAYASFLWATEDEDEQEH